MTRVQCIICGKAVFKYPSQLRPQNCCSAECRNELNRLRNLEINVPGHNAGHPAPWLTKFNRLLSIHENTVNVEPETYRAVVEKAIGRKLRRDEVVHHINGDRTDNRLENLQVMSNSEHSRIHHAHASMRYAAGKAVLGGDVK